MVTQLPPELRGERPLAEYFENMGLSVESVNICRDVGSLKKILDKRTEALLKLESAWVQYVGNPAVVESSGNSDRDVMPLVDVDASDVEDQRKRIVVPHRPRPTLRPGWFRPKVDALEYLEAEFKKIDELFVKRRRAGKFRASHAAFITFEKMSSAVSHHLFSGRDSQLTYDWNSKLLLKPSMLRAQLNARHVSPLKPGTLYGLQ